MGQVCTIFQDKFKGKKWRAKQIRMITDKVFDTIRVDHKEHLTFEELYIAILHVYNEMNKRLPGPHFDPPSEDKVKDTMKEFDVNLDGLIDREEFAEFMKKLTADAVVMVTRKLIIALLLAPVMAMLSKKGSEGIPGVGGTVKRMPKSVYASIFTIAVVLFLNFGRDHE